MVASRLLRRSRLRTWFSNSAKSCSSGYAYGETLQQMQQYDLKRLNLPRNAFGVAFDIDGVFIRGSEVIGRGPEAVRRLYKDVEKGELLVPYIFLTNGGGTTEAVRAEVLSRLLSVPVNPIQVNLGHTPVKSLAKRYRSKRGLAVGKGEPETAMISYGFSTVIKMDKYCEEFQYIDPLQSYKPWVRKYDASVKDMIMPANERQIAAVFVCSDPIDWGRDLQVLCDVLRAGGYPGKIDAKIAQPPLFFAADDFEYPTKFPVPRFGMGAFRIILESLYGRLMNRPLSCTSFGKPKPVVYHLAAKSLQNVTRMMSSEHGMTPEPGDRARKDECALRTLYMIGDNPETDIAGAIGAGRPWYSILVRSGNFRGPGNHDKYPADKVVDAVYAAVDFILKKEGISTN